MSYRKKITSGDFCRLFHSKPDELPTDFQERFDSVNTNFRSSEKADIEEYILEILEKINSPFITRNRDENLKAWEKGWNENLEEFQSGFFEKNLKPKYFRPSKFFRYNKKIIIPENEQLEYDLFNVVRYYLFRKYFSRYDSVYELGAGSCQNVLTLAKLFPNKKIYGLDWANSSNKIANIIGTKMNRNVKGVSFDLTDPSEQMEVEDNSIVFSIHSLEQLGTSHGKLLSFLLERKPSLVLNYEPIVELYDESNVYDYLAIIYSKKRNYLSGYLVELRKLANSGKIEIIEERRPYIGGIYHEASLVVWKPL